MVDFFSGKHFTKEKEFTQGCQMEYFKQKILVWVNFGESCN
jgi:hypothetical protein